VNSANPQWCSAIRTEKPPTVVLLSQAPFTLGQGDFMGIYRSSHIAVALVSMPLVATTAGPAATPAYQPALVIAVIYDWTGLYVGAHVVGGWAGSQAYAAWGE
jgi:hypothetical protein